MPAGTLFVVATPIGNLEDVTLRALRVLGEVNLIAAEDTRRTSRLLARHGIATPTISFHEHNTHTRTPGLLRQLREGRSIALVTDAGTPGVSDPGSELVAACRAAAIPVEPVPGPNASLTAALASGFPMIPMTVLGFPPYRSNDRTDWLKTLAQTRHTVTFFEAPHRIQRTLRDIAPILGTRQIMVGRELTKAHQEFVFGTADSVLLALTTVKGEFTVVVAPAELEKGKDVEALTDKDVADQFWLMANSATSSRREAVAAVAAKLGKSQKDVYAAIERAKKATV